MRITQGVHWQACSTLMLGDLSYRTKTEFAEEMLKQLEFLASKEHYAEYNALQQRVSENKIPNLNIYPVNYVAPGYKAEAFSWLICSTNGDQKNQRQWLRELGFLESPPSYNTKNHTTIILFFIPPKDAIQNLKEYLKTINQKVES